MPFNDECLPDVWEVQIVVKLSGGPDFSEFYTSMIRWSNIDIIRLLPITEVKLNIFKECGLISFDGEVVMGLARYQIFCEFTLC